MEYLYVFGIIFVVFGISFVLINVWQIVIGNEFCGICVINNFMLKSEVGECIVCGKKFDEECKMLEFGKGGLNVVQ